MAAEEDKTPGEPTKKSKLAKFIQEYHGALSTLSGHSDAPALEEAARVLFGLDANDSAIAAPVPVNAVSPH